MNASQCLLVIVVMGNLATGISNAAMPKLMYSSPPSWHDQGLYGDAETK